MMRFIGALTGDVAEAELLFLPVVKSDPGLRRAYLTGVKYEGDDKTRVALCIDSSTPRRKIIEELARRCAQLRISADIVFFEDMGQFQIDSIKDRVRPFYDVDSK